MSHLTPKVYIPDLGVDFNNFRGKVVSVQQPKSDSDKLSLYQLAGNIKRHILKQISDPQEQINTLQSFHPGQAPSKWSIEVVYGLRVFFHPTDDVDKVLPKEFEPTAAELVPYHALFDSNWDESFFVDPSRWNGITDKALRILLSKINTLFLGGSDLASQDKAETDAMFRSLVDYLGVGDPGATQVILEENLNLITKLGKYEYNTKVEFAFTLRKYFGNSNVFGFVEDKRFLKSSPQQNLAQRVAESLAIADTNFDIEDQQVFGVCVRHRFFTFWHGYFPSAYMIAVRSDPSTLTSEDYAVLKCFPESNFGLDICVPAERELIVKLLLRLIKYIDTDPV